MRRILIRVILIAAAAFLVFFIFGGLFNSMAGQTKPPGTDDAPWVIKTDTRVYYVKMLSMVEKMPVAEGYWTLDGKRYHYHKETKEFSDNLYPYIRIVNRGAVK